MSSGARENVYTFVLGKKAQGKTLYAKAIARTRPRRVILDPARAFGSEFGHVLGVRQGIAALRKAGPGPVRIVIRPGWDESVADVFREVFGAGNLLLVADEAGDYGSSSSCDPDFMRLMEKGRNRRVDVVTTAQAITALHPKIRNNWDVVVCFCLGSPLYAQRTALEYFHRPELASSLLRLPRFHFLRVENGGGITRGRVPDPAARGVTR